MNAPRGYLHMLYIAEQSGGGLGQNQGVETPRDTCLPAMRGPFPRGLGS